MSPVVRRPIYIYLRRRRNPGLAPKCNATDASPALRARSLRSQSVTALPYGLENSHNHLYIEYREYIYPAWTASYLQHNLVTPQICTMYELMIYYYYIHMLYVAAAEHRLTVLQQVMHYNNSEHL